MAIENTWQYERKFLKAVGESLVELDAMRKKHTWLEGLYAALYEGYQAAVKTLKEWDEWSKEPTSQKELAAWKLRRFKAMAKRPSLVFQSALLHVKELAVERSEKVLADGSEDTSVVTGLIDIIEGFDQPCAGKAQGEDKKDGWLGKIVIFIAGLASRDILNSLFGSSQKSLTE